MQTNTKSILSRAGFSNLAGREFQSTPAARFVGGEIRRFSKAKAVAERLGVCPRTIFRWADEGKIARHKINARVVLFDESEVIALLESARVTAFRQ